MEFYVHLNRVTGGEHDRSETIVDGRVILDYDAAGVLIGVEVLAADSVSVAGATCDLGDS